MRDATPVTRLLVYQFKLHPKAFWWPTPISLLYPWSSYCQFSIRDHLIYNWISTAPILLINNSGKGWCWKQLLVVGNWFSILAVSMIVDLLSANGQWAIWNAEVVFQNSSCNLVTFHMVFASRVRMAWCSIPFHVILKAGGMLLPRLALFIMGRISASPKYMYK